MTFFSCFYKIMKEGNYCDNLRLTLWLIIIIFIIINCKEYMHILSESISLKGKKENKGKRFICIFFLSLYDGHEWCFVVVLNFYLSNIL